MSDEIKIEPVYKVSIEPLCINKKWIGYNFFIFKMKYDLEKKIYRKQIFGKYTLKHQELGELILKNHINEYENHPVEG